MGTSYTLTYYGGPRSGKMQSQLDDLFANIDQQLSNWNPDSWVRRFNERDANTAMELPDHVKTVLQRTLRLSETTGGALDPTLGRPINMWGFGPFEHERPIDATTLKNVLKSTGTNKLTVRDNPPALSKSHPDLRLNFSATAKGYAIDRVARLLEDRRIQNYKIVIGGDLRTNGSPSGNDAWKIVVQQPPSDPSNASASRRTQELNNQAMATTGDYHRYVEVNGKKRPHVLNPNTAAPVDTSLASVSVLAPSALTADGLATACFVLGEEDARQLLSSMNDVEALFIHRTSPDGFRIRTTKGWPK